MGWLVFKIKLAGQTQASQTPIPVKLVPLLRYLAANPDHAIFKFQKIFYEQAVRKWPDHIPPFPSQGLRVLPVPTISVKWENKQMMSDELRAIFFKWHNCAK